MTDMTPPRCECGSSSGWEIRKRWRDHEMGVLCAMWRCTDCCSCFVTSAPLQKTPSEPDDVTRDSAEVEHATWSHAEKKCLLQRREHLEKRVNYLEQRVAALEGHDATRVCMTCCAPVPSHVEPVEKELANCEKGSWGAYQCFDCWGRNKGSGLGVLSAAGGLRAIRLFHKIGASDDS